MTGDAGATCSPGRRRAETKHEIALSGRRVDLFALAERHLPLVIAWRNNPAIRQLFFNRRIFTTGSQAEWFARYAVDPTAFNFVIALKSGRTIGMVAISKIDWRECSGEFGRFLIGDPLSLGRGYGREAAALILDFARSELGLTSVSLVVLPGNAAAVRLYRELGFVEAGHFRGRLPTGRRSWRSGWSSQWAPRPRSGRRNRTPSSPEARNALRSARFSWMMLRPLP